MAYKKREVKVTHSTEGLEFVFTKDEKLIEEFTQLIEDKYTHFINYNYVHSKRLIRNYIHLQKDRYFLNDFVHPLLILKDGKCVGGSAIVTHAKSTSTTLPIEYEKFNLPTAFAHLELQDKTYSELYRFVLEDEYRSREIMDKLMYLSTQKAIEMKSEYLFLVATYVMSRSFRMLLSKYKYILKTHHEINLPQQDDYGRLNVYPTVIDLLHKHEDKVPKKSVFNPNTYNESSFFNDLRNKAENLIKEGYIADPTQDILSRNTRQTNGNQKSQP
jgi:hypothetical protein